MSNRTLMEAAIEFLSSGEGLHKIRVNGQMMDRKAVADSLASLPGRDEEAIRADERERCAKVADEAMKSKNLADRSPKHIATAIRALDLSPASGDYVVVPMELALSLTRLADYENDPDGPHHTLSTLLNAATGAGD